MIIKLGLILVLCFAKTVSLLIARETLSVSSKDNNMTMCRNNHSSLLTCNGPIQSPGLAVNYTVCTPSGPVSAGRGDIFLLVFYLGK